MSTTITTTLRIVGTFDPDEITRELSWQPTRTWRCGDTRDGAPLISYDEDGWVTKLGQGPSLHVHERLADALALLRPHAAQLRKTLRAHNSRGQLCVGVDVADGQIPSIALSASEMGDLAAMDLSLDIDIV